MDTMVRLHPVKASIILVLKTPDVVDVHHSTGLLLNLCTEEDVNLSRLLKF